MKLKIDLYGSKCNEYPKLTILYNQTIKSSQDIDVGDELIGDDGEKRIVQKLIRGEDDMYEITQNNGEKYIVNSKHKLVFKYVSDRSIGWSENLNLWKVSWFCREKYRNRTKDFKIADSNTKEEAFQKASDFVTKLDFSREIEIKVDDYIKLPQVVKNRLVGFKSSNGINYSKKEIKMEPYLLGLWLGDGTHTNSVIASNDYEIQKYLYEWCEKNDAELIHDECVKFRIRRFDRTNYKNDLKLPIGSKKDSCESCIKSGKNYEICKLVKQSNLKKSDIITNPFMDQLKTYNLVGNKHIPSDYLINDRETRLKVLAGLIDTDGHVSNSGKRSVIIQTSPVLSNQIIALARSCGFVVNVRIVERRAESIFDGEPKDYKDQYHNNISGEFLHEIPTILPRKKCVSSNPNRDYYATTIDVTKIKKDNYYGWSVDKNKRFLLPDHTVVRNCDQMFCVSCHTAFSWDRGTIEKGVIHNPHFYQWQKTVQATAVTQIPAVDLCNENYFPSISDLSVYQKSYDSYTEKWLFKFHQFITHLYLAVRPAYLTTSSTDLKMEINVNYMMTAFGKTEWKKRLYEADRRQEMARDMVELIDMVYAISGERFRNFIRERDAQHIKDVGTLLVYTMDEFDKIKKRHMIKNTIVLEPSWYQSIKII